MLRFVDVNGSPGFALTVNPENVGAAAAEPWLITLTIHEPSLPTKPAPANGVSGAVMVKAPLLNMVCNGPHPQLSVKDPTHMFEFVGAPVAGIPFPSAQTETAIAPPRKIWLARVSDALSPGWPRSPGMMKSPACAGTRARRSARAVTGIFMA